MLHTPTLTVPPSNPTASPLLRRATDQFATQLSAAINATDTTIPLSGVAGLSTDTAVTLVIEPGTARQETVIGWVSSLNLINVARHCEGATIDHPINSIVMSYQTAQDHNSIIDFLLIGHDPITGLPDADSVATAALQAEAVTAGKIAANAVTFAKLAANIFGAQVTPGTNAGTAGGSMSSVNLGGLKLAWGVSDVFTVPTATAIGKGVLFPTSFFTAAPTMAITNTAPSVEADQTVYLGSVPSAGAAELVVYNPSGGGTTGSTRVSWFAIGV